MNINVRITNYHWDNYQGGSGEIVIQHETVSIPNSTPACEIQNEVVEQLNKKGFCSSWHSQEFRSNGIISMEVSKQ